MNQKIKRLIEKYQKIKNNGAEYVPVHQVINDLMSIR